ncbi:MAG: exodeoxyribonuclease VII small subunit [Coxiellaceae bacterium]|nr:exodeoxyribonuclease VII small subunit [Coxiellaceae bacterium]
MATTRISRKNNISNAIDFEASLKQLNSLIEKMESGNLSLNESLSCFEEGVNLIKQCQGALTEAEQKIELITEKKSHA